MARYLWMCTIFLCILHHVVTQNEPDELLCINDIMCAALNESYNLNYNCIYGAAFFYLNMEDECLQNSSSIVKGNTIVKISTVPEDDCNSIMQIQNNDTIPGFRKAMSINSSNDNQTYVNITGKGNFTKGLTASLWIQHAHTQTDEENCTILYVGTETNHLKLKRKTNSQRNLSYSIEHGTVEVTSFSASNFWDWNMLSFTIELQDEATDTCLISMFDNGALISNYTQTPNVLPIEFKIWLNGNGHDGCKDLVLDELAVWETALNMSQLIALRVQPFNSTTNESCADEFVPSESIDKLAKAPAADASREAILFATFVDTVEKFEDDDIVNMNKFMDIIEERGFFVGGDVDEETHKVVRNSYVAVANSLFNVSESDTNQSHNIDQFSLMKQIEGMAKTSFFNSSLDNENITTEYITLAYARFPQLSATEELVFQADAAQFTIPGAHFKSGETAKVIVCVYSRSISKSFNKFIKSNETNISVQSNIVSLQINSKLATFIPPIQMAFEVNTSDRNGLQYIPTCSYMDETKWSASGVKTNKSKKELVSCELSHLTNFAVLVAVKPIEIDEAQDAILSALTYILITISIICLILALVILFCLRELDNTQRIQILKHFVAALLCAQLLFVLGTPLFKDIKPICLVTSVILHYLWLAVFTWMLVQGIQLYTKVRLLAGGNIKQLYYVLFAWGFPIPICLIPLIIFKDDYTNQKICWIPPAAVYFFAVPVMLVFIINLAVTVMVMNTFLTVKVNKDKSKTDKLKSSMRAVVVMVPILGLTWVFGFLIMIKPDVVLFNYLFTILNPLQGVFVFLFHFVLNEDVRSAVLRRRNKVAASAENTIFTKLPRQKGEQSEGYTQTTKDPLPSDSGTNM